MTDVVAADTSRADPRRLLARAARNLVETTIVYLAVAVVSGTSYALAVVILDGATFFRLWLAALGPIAVFLIARSLLLVYRRRLVGEKQLDLFDRR